MDPDRNTRLSLREPASRRLPQWPARYAKIGCRARSLEDPVALRYPHQRLEALEKRPSRPMPRRSSRQLLSQNRFLFRRSPHPGRRPEESARKSGAANREEGPDPYRDPCQSSSGRRPLPGMEVAPGPLRWSGWKKGRDLTRFVRLRKGRLFRDAVLLPGQQTSVLRHLELVTAVGTTPRALPVFPPRGIVISTEAAHSLIVSSVVEKPPHFVFLPLPVEAPKRLILLPLPLPVFIFRVFRPKNACQAPKPRNCHKQNKIELAFSFLQPAILKIVEKK